MVLPLGSERHPGQLGRPWAAFLMQEINMSRWKIMTGMFAISLGGLAAIAGQGFKKATDAKSSPPEAPQTVVLHEPPLVSPTSAAVRMAPPADLVVPAAVSPLIPTPLDGQVHVASGMVELPLVPPMPLPGIALEPATLPVPHDPVLITPVAHDEPKIELAPPPSVIGPPPVLPPAADAVIPPLTTVKPAELIATEGVRYPQPGNKYRITLRVGGDGEPVFEVRNGDELVMKVVCEKVDVKAPIEKGHSVSAIKAMGHVRFVGFGSEGTCEELAFVAGTGEVSLGGNVKVQVKDKFGRVETELTGEKMNYRLDAAHHLTGGLEP